MRELVLDWDSDSSAVDLVPLRGYKCYETHRWDHVDLPVWTNLVEGGSDADPVPFMEVCQVLSDYLPRFDKVIERDWKGREEFEMKSVFAYGFNRNFSAIVNPEKGESLDSDCKLGGIGFYLRNEGIERRDLWFRIVRKLNHLPLLVHFQHFVKAQCLINDQSNLERIWDELEVKKKKIEDMWRKT